MPYRKPIYGVIDNCNLYILQDWMASIWEIAPDFACKRRLLCLVFKI